MMLIGLDKSGQKSDIYHTARQERRKPKGEIQMKNKKYYIAYGSNLSVEQMADRCPDAKIVGQAVLAGWELLFRGCATIAPNLKKNTPVLVWEISERDEGNLFFGFFLKLLWERVVPPSGFLVFFFPDVVAVVNVQLVFFFKLCDAVFDCGFNFCNGLFHGFCLPFLV